MEHIQIRKAIQERMEEYPDTYGDIPERIIQGLLRYIEAGSTPGQFLRGVLENNLAQAVTYADKKSEQALCGLVKLITHTVPGSCWGGPEKVKRWIQKGGLDG